MSAPSTGRGLLPYQIVMGVAMAAIGGIIVVLGELRDDLGVGNTAIGVIVTAGFFASFVAQIALAPLADRGHGRTMAVAGIGLSAVALLVMVFADAVGVWVLARAALGFATGLLLPGIRRAATVLDPTRAGENLGRLVVGEVLGFVLGPIIAAGVAEIGGVRAPFLVFAVIMIVFLPFVWRLPEDQGRRTERARNPIELLRGRRLQGALVLIFGYFFLVGSFESVIPLMFQDRGGGALEAGIAFTVFAIPVAAVSPYAGRVADRVGGANVAIAGMAVSAALTAMYGFLPGIWWLVAIMTVIGVADGFGFTAGQVAVSRSVAEDRQAGALGLMGAAEVLGAGVAALPAAALYEAGGARPTWIVVSGASLAFLALGWLRLRGTHPILPTAPSAGPVDAQPAGGSSTAAGGD